MSKEYAKTAVAAGITFLDQHSDVPRDWRSKIDLTRLTVFSTDYCPLGQLFGDYYDGARKLGISGTDKTHEYGFCSYSYATNEELTDAWKAALTAKYNVSDRLNIKGDRDAVLTVVATWAEDSGNWYVVKYDRGGSHIKSEHMLDRDFEKYTPFPFANGDILTNKERSQFLVVRNGENRLERLSSTYGTEPQTRNGTYAYYVSEYGELQALSDSMYRKFSEV